MDSLFEVQPFRAYRQFNEIKNETLVTNKEAQRKTIVLLLQMIRANEITYLAFLQYIELLKKAYLINIFINDKFKMSLSLFTMPFFQKIIDINKDLYALCNELISALKADKLDKYYQFAKMMDEYDIAYLLHQFMGIYSVKNIRELIETQSVNDIYKMIEKIIPKDKIVKGLEISRSKIEELEKIIQNEQQGGLEKTNYNQIKCPITNKWININTNKGKKIISKYIEHLEYGR